MDRLIELCCGTCEYHISGEDGQYICAYDGNLVMENWFCRRWEQKEDESDA